MNDRRKIALALALVFTCFSAGLTARLVMLYERETRIGILTNAEWTALTERLKADPNDTALVEAIRGLDVRLRQDYFRARRQYEVGGYLLMAALIGMVLSARWYFDQSPTSPADAKARRLRVTEEMLAESGRRSAWSVGIVTGVFLTTLGVIAVGQRGEFPGATGIADAAAAPPAASAASPFKQNWPSFRGPGGIGVAGDGDWPTTWSVTANLNVLWKTPIPAPGKSSPIVWGDRIFLTGGDKTTHHVMCFDRGDGRLLWDKTVAPAPAAGEQQVSEEAGFAAPTAVTDGRRVYAMFATGMLAAFDFEGNRVWAKSLGTPENLYGLASSPMLHENTLLLQYDQGMSGEEKKSRLIGFDPATGQERWSIVRELPNSWATPALIQVGGRTELITCADPLVVAYDPATGKELWSVKGLRGDVAPSPAFDGERVIVTNDVAETLAIRPGGGGDVTATHVLWRSEDGMPDIASPVSDGRRVLLVNAGGYITCLNAADGKRHWEKSLECSFSASPVVAGGRIYFFGEDGIARVLESADQYRLYARGEVGEPIHVTPAFGDNQIYIRGEKHLFGIGVRR